MKRFTAFLFAAVLSFTFLGTPEFLEAKGGHGGGGRGGGGRGGGHHGGGHRGGHHGGHHKGGGGTRGGFIYYGAPGFGAGYLAGYWSNGYYYTYPENGVCERWVPTGGYHLESRQDPGTGVWYEVEEPDGYWEVVPCY